MTTLENKMQILHDLYIMTDSDSEYAEFVGVHDLGIPLSVLVIQNCAIATEAGIAWIDIDFEALCEELEIDKHGDYESLDEMLDLSEQG